MFKQNDNQRTITVHDFDEMVNFLSAFVSTKTNIEEYKCFRFSGNKVVVGDVDFGASFQLKCDFGDKKFAIPAKILTGLAGKFDKTQNIAFEVVDNQILITCEAYSGKFPMLAATEFNEFSEPTEQGTTPPDFIDGINFLSDARSKKVHEAKRALLLGATFTNGSGYATNMNVVAKYEFMFDSITTPMPDFTMPQRLFNVIKKNKIRPSTIGFDEQYIYVYYGDIIATRCKRYAVKSEGYINLEKFFNETFRLDDMAQVSIKVKDIIDAVERLRIVQGADGVSKLRITLLNEHEFRVENIDGKGRCEEIICCEAIIPDSTKTYIATTNANNLSYLFSQYKVSDKDKDEDVEDEPTTFYLEEGKKLIISNAKKSNVVSCIMT